MLLLVGNVPKALEATASYLLFFPTDETMVENKDFYLTLPGVKEDMFKPRKEAIEYHERDVAEKSLLKFIETHFQFDEGDISEPNGNGSSDVPQAEGKLLRPDGSSHSYGDSQSDEINQISDT